MTLNDPSMDADLGEALAACEFEIGEDWADVE
jgi:hypothetical protein